MAQTENGFYYPDDYTKVADVPGDLKKLAESIDVEVGNIKSNQSTNSKDIEQLKKTDETQNKNIEQISEDVEEIKEEQKTQNANIEELQKNQEKLQAEVQELNEDIKANAIIEETEKSKSLYIDDANASRGKVNVFGNMEQEIREGYNIYDYLPRIKASQGGLTTTKDEKTGYITINGTPTSDYTTVTNELDITDLLEDGQTYTLWQEKHKDSNTYGVYMQVTETTPDNTNNFYFSRDENKTFVVNKANTYKINIQIGSIANTKTLNNYKNRYMIYKGTDDKLFELYGATPSPKYPSEIKVIKTGNTQIKRIGKNIMPILQDYWNYTDEGIKNISKNEGRQITSFLVKKGEKIKLGFKMLNSNVTASISFTVFLNGSANNSLSFVNIQNFSIGVIEERTYEAQEDTIVSATLYGNANNETFEFQMWAEFETLTDYERYKEEVYNLDIQKEMLLGDGFNLNAKKEEHGWNKIILDGSDDEDWVLNSSFSDAFTCNKPTDLASYETELICNITDNFLTSGEDLDSSEHGIAIGNRINLKIEGISTLEELKQYLNNTNIILYYKSTQKTELDLTDTQIQQLEKLNKLRFYEGVNNIMTTEDIALLQAKYSQNLKVTNTKMQQQIDEIKELLSTTQTSAMLLDNLEKDLIEEVK